MITKSHMSTQKVSKCSSVTEEYNELKVHEQKTMNKVENNDIISPGMSVQTTVSTRRGINKMPKCFSCPGNCKELSKKTRRSAHDSNQAKIKPIHGLADLTDDL